MTTYYTAEGGEIRPKPQDGPKPATQKWVGHSYH